MQRNKDRRVTRRKKPLRDRYDVASLGKSINYGILKADRAERQKINPQDKRLKLKKEEHDERLVPHWHPHQLRHTAATRLRKEFGIELTRVILGHTSAEVTTIYAERDIGLAINAMSKAG